MIKSNCEMAILRIIPGGMCEMCKQKIMEAEYILYRILLVKFINQ